MSGDDRDKTPILCLACGGRYRTSRREDDGTYIDVQCRFCLDGSMSPSQFRVWRDWRLAEIARESLEKK